MLQYALQALLIVAFLTGGSSIVSGWDDAAVQLLSLPLLAFALWRIFRLPASKARNIGLAVAGLVALVPLLQLLPLPEGVWRFPEARQWLAADLTAVGAQPAFRWSLTPAATERAFLFLLPPLAAFCATLAVGMDAHRGLLRTIMLLVAFSLLLAFLQLGVPAESLLNPFPQWARQFNGIFANPNHQGISLVVAIIIAVAGMMASLPNVRDGVRQAWTPWVLGFLALFALCALPLTQSRASVLIGTVAVAIVPLAMGMFTRRRLHDGWGARAGLAGSITLIGLGAWATVGWMQVAVVDELRGPLREAAFALGREHAPLGTGVGAFVAAFEQGAPDSLLLSRYVNHVHNEYIQWWLETGWLGVLVATTVFAFLATASVQVLVRHGGSRMVPVAAVLGLAALLLHSWVDYPLRTGSLAIVAGVLAGIVVARAWPQGDVGLSQADIGEDVSLDPGDRRDRPLGRWASITARWNQAWARS